jgi:hypothetical protein
VKVQSYCLECRLFNIPFQLSKDRNSQLCLSFFHFFARVSKLIEKGEKRKFYHFVRILSLSLILYFRNNTPLLILHMLTLVSGVTSTAREAGEEGKYRLSCAPSGPVRSPAVLISSSCL